MPSSKEPDRDTKPFAERMVADHQKTSSKLKSLVESGKVKATPPTALGPSTCTGYKEGLRGKFELKLVAARMVRSAEHGCAAKSADEGG